MSNQPNPDVKLPDPTELSKNLVKIATQSQQLVTDFLARQGNGQSSPDPLNIGSAFLEMLTRLMADPAKQAAFGEAGRRRAVEVFSWGAIAKQTQALYETLVSAPKPSA